MLERLQACAGPSPARMYGLEAENRKRTDEVRELQKVWEQLVAAGCVVGSSHRPFKFYTVPYSSVSIKA